MPGPVLYSVNPWFAIDVADKYRGGMYFAWVCECFDSAKAPAGSAASMIAPSSNPRRIYEHLWEEYHAQEEHSKIIRDHKKTFTRLGKQWLAAGEIAKDQYDEIVASVKAPSWKIWKPVLYVIPREPIVAARRLVAVTRSDRAGYGPEHQIVDLQRHEFDIVELPGLVHP
jgi:hypothetical protein